MIRSFFAGLVSLVIIGFLLINTAVLMARVSQAEGLINIKYDATDEYIYPDEARWLKYDLARKGKRVKDDKVYFSLAKFPPTKSPGEAFIIVDNDDNPYPEMPKDEPGKTIHTLVRFDYGWDWQSKKDQSLKTRVVGFLDPFLRRPVGVKGSALEKDKEGFINASIVNFLVSAAAVLIPGLIIRQLLKRGI